MRTDELPLLTLSYAASRTAVPHYPLMTPPEQRAASRSADSLLPLIPCNVVHVVIGF